MAYIIPHNQKRALRDALDAAGWNVELEEPPNEAWWMHELWRVRSKVRPVGVEAHVTFVGGPDGGGAPHPGASHVAVGSVPSFWQLWEDIPRFPLAESWAAQRERIVETLSRIRAAALSNDGIP